MTNRDMSPNAVAGRLWDAASASCVDGAATAVVIDALLARLESGLRRWVGAEGYAALLARAVAHTRVTHPALAGVSDLGADAAGPDPAVPPDEAAQRDAIIALVCTMMQQLGGIIGDSMATRLFEQTMTPRVRGATGIESNETPS